MNRVRNRRTLGATLLSSLLALFAGALQGQEPVQAAIEGTLLFGAVPLDSGIVVLHRVTPEDAGPLDSVRVDSAGRFRLALPQMPIPGSGEIFFASSRFDGIVYFGPPITDPIDLDAPYEIRVYPTRPSPEGGAELSVEVRNLLLEEGPWGWRIVDLFQIHNDTEFTWISEGEGRPVWRHPLPPGATNFRVGESDLVPDAVRFEGDALHVFSPISPGDRIFVVQYEVEEVEFDLPMPGHTAFLDILVRDPAPSIRIPELTRGSTEEFERGSEYRRWWGEDIRDRVIRIEEGAEPPEIPLAWVAVIVAVFLAMVGVWAVSRPPSEGARESREELRRQLARLEEVWEGSTEEERANSEYHARRQGILDRFEALDSRGGDEGGA